MSKEAVSTACLDRVVFALSRQTKPRTAYSIAHDAGYSAAQTRRALMRLIELDYAVRYRSSQDDKFYYVIK